jgi:hypothetical protein
MNQPMENPLKIAVVLNSGNVSLWIYRLIENILSAGFAELKLVIYYNEPPDSHKYNKPFFYRLHERIDRFISRNRIDYNKIVNVSEKLKGIKNTSVNSSSYNIKSKNTYKVISNQNLDIILNFTSYTFNENGLILARYGIWHYGIENNSPAKDISNGYWELVKKVPTLRIVIRSSNMANEKGIVLFRSWIPTNYNSIHLNLDHAYGLCSAIVPRLIKMIHQSGFEYLDSQVIKNRVPEEEHNHNFLLSLSNSQALINILKVVFRYLLNRMLYQDERRWFVAYKQDKNPFPATLEKYKALVPPKDRFWADPFVIRRNNKVFIFVEEFLYKTNKGHIALLELDNEGKLLHTRKILEKPYHMSYPFLIEYDNCYYMIPETHDNKTIELYKCDEFPDKWSFVMNLKENIVALDTTMFFYENKWWLFTAVNECLNFPDYTELFLFYSDSLFTSDWRSHPGNPIDTDIRSARPAGKIFSYENKLYRPSQDCSDIYGRAYNLNQINTLSETSYNEVLVSKAEAKWEPDLKGTHTLNFDKDFIVVDAFKINKRISFQLL